MTDAEILTKIRSAILEEISAPVETIVPTTRAATVPGWDSLAHTRIIMNLELCLGIVVDMDATYQVADIEGLIAIVRKALPSKG
jgi:acyl carrier protein